MINLNFSNVEELLFHNREAQQCLPTHMFSLFEQWRLGKRIPMLRSLGKAALLDVLNALTEEDIATLEQYFGDRIILEKLNYSIVRNLKIPLAEKAICEELCKVDGFYQISTWRDNEYIYISFWR